MSLGAVFLEGFALCVVLFAAVMSTHAELVLSLINPPASRTSDSIAVLWDHLAGAESYEVFVDSAKATTTTKTDCTLQGLTASRDYEIMVRARVGTASVQSNTIHVSTAAAPRMFDISACGAVGDGRTINTAAIQAAIDACTPGGMVRIPRGLYRTGAIYLKGDMTLQLDEDAVLLGSDDTKDYPVMRYRFEGLETDCYASLINTRNTSGSRLRNIAIMGAGTIDANGAALRQKELAEKKGKPGRAICIRNTDNVYLQGITIRQSPAWCVHLIYCNGISANGVSIHTRFDEQGRKYEGIVNGDGLNPDSCRDVFIFNSHIASQDDCIAIKSGRDAEGRAVGIPTENVRVSNCRFTSGFGVAVGSEMAGGVRNVLVEDCVFEDTFSIASVKAPRGRGGVVENITYRKCTLINRDADHHDCEWFRGALYIDNFYSHRNFEPHQPEPRDEGTPAIRNVLFENITLDTVGGNAIYLTGLPESPLENIRLVNVAAMGKHGFVANNVRGLILDRVTVDAREGKAMRFVNVR